MNTLPCPACNEECRTMPSGPDGTWFEGVCGVCQCGAKLYVAINLNGTAWLEIGEDEEE